MKVTIKERGREVFFEGRWYPTDIEIDVPISIALRMSQVYRGMEIGKDSKKEYNPLLFRDRKIFGFTSHIDSVSGWGNVSYNLLKYCKYYNISQVGPLYNINDPEIWKMARGELYDTGAMVWHEQPKETWLSSPFAKNIAIVPFETTIIPKSWIERINSFDVLIVPCEQNRQAFADSGVTIPIEIVRWGYEPALYNYIDRPKRNVFTFGTMGALSVRKGTDTLVEAFREAFPAHLYPDVRLICKTSYNNYPFMVKDDRIVIQMTPVTYDELIRDFFAQVDCFVFPTRGEGCGMPPMEAMATGLPVIVTGWSGPMEYMNEECGWLLDYSMGLATDFTQNIYKEECGEWANPSKEHLIELMRYAYEHQDECREKGLKAAQYMRDNWTWEKRIQDFKDVLEKYL